MQPQPGIWKRFIKSLLVVDRGSPPRDLEEAYRRLLLVDRCSLSWGCGRGLLEVY